MVTINKQYINIPVVCPACGEKTTIVQENESKVLMCLNPQCQGKCINQLVHFAGKKGLNILGLSEKTLEKLVEWGWVTNYIDLFHLADHRDEWTKIQGFGAASVDKILGAIETSREVNLDKMIAALGIPTVGTTAAKDLAQHFGSWAEFIKAIETNFKFYVLPNFGPEAHKALTGFDYTEAIKLVADELDVTDVSTAAASTTVKDKVFVITGKLPSIGTRDKAKALIEAAGGKVTGSVSKNTNYLVNNDSESTSSKNQAAKRLGVSIITEEELLEMLG